MDYDGDFSAYAAARWGNLVRSAVVLGCTLEDAHDLAQTTLNRCYMSWRKVSKATTEMRTCTGSCSTVTGTAVDAGGGENAPPAGSPSSTSPTQPRRWTSPTPSTVPSTTSAMSTAKWSSCATWLN